MSEVLEKAGAEALTELVGWMNNAEVFVQAEAPELAQDIIRIGIMGNTFGVVVSVAILTLSIEFMIYSLKKHREDHYAMWDFWAGLTVIPVIIGLIIGLCSTYCLIKVLIAPKLFLLEKVSSLITGGC